MVAQRHNVGFAAARGHGRHGGGRIGAGTSSPRAGICSGETWPQTRALVETRTGWGSASDNVRRIGNPVRVLKTSPSAASPAPKWSG